MFSGRRVIILIFAAALFFVGGGILVTYRVGAEAVRATRQMGKKLSVLNPLSDFMSTLKDAETGQRGYLLTGDTNYLEPYNRALAHVENASQNLRALAAAGRLPKETTQRIIELTTQKLGELDQTIKLREQGRSWTGHREKSCGSHGWQRRPGIATRPGNLLLGATTHSCYELNEVVFASITRLELAAFPAPGAI